MRSLPSFGRQASAKTKGSNRAKVPRPTWKAGAKEFISLRLSVLARKKTTSLLYALIIPNCTA
uniref:hypothetical protein n=1 Tax=Algoriphagus sp. TaxID=1872435 RepID=UPI004048345A